MLKYYHIEAFYTTIGLINYTKSGTPLPPCTLCLGVLRVNLRQKFFIPLPKIMFVSVVSVVRGGIPHSS